jgi:hypothetical protein
MKRFLKPFLILLSLGIWSVSYGQVEKIRQALEDDNPKRALKLVENGMEDGTLKKVPEAYFLQADAYFQLMKDIYYFSKNPDVLKLGIKAIEKGKSRNGGTIPSEFDLLVDSFVLANNVDAHNNYKINKFTKAIKLYNTSYELNGDMPSLFWRGYCYILYEDTLAGESDLTKVVEWAIDEEAEGGKPDKAMAEAFLYFGEKYWNAAQYDSANYYLEAGRKIYDDNERIDYYMKEVAKAQIKSLSPSPYMMEIIQRTLTYFPKDEYFIRKENALYLYQIRNYLKAEDKTPVNRLIDKFVDSKIDRSNSIHATYFKKKDRFIAEKPENVLWKLASYYNEFDHIEASNFIVDKYVAETAESKSDEDIKDRYTVIISFASKNKSLSMANQLLKYAEDKYGKSQEYSDLRNSLIAEFEGKELAVQDMGALYQLNLDNQAPFDEKFETLVSEYIDALIQNKQYVKARLIIYENSVKEPSNPLWNDKYLYLAKDDFYYSYYMTRVQEETVAGMKVNGFEWNGDLRMCKEGDISEEILEKLEIRINYFRRQAGLNAIVLDGEYNNWCQQAALMMQANRKLDHEPKTNWRCYTDEGAFAARNALMLQGTHTSRAITSFFADNQNPTLGNRRWMLFPNGKFYGFGGTEEYSVLWVLDDSGNIDSSIYETQFISWPPEGYLPKMMVFKYWSFSLDQDLNGATITMTSNGENIPVTVQPVEDGYGLNTIVWEPNTPLNKVKEDKIVEVTVTLKNGRRYSYTVHIMNFDAVGY